MKTSLIDIAKATGPYSAILVTGDLTSVASPSELRGSTTAVSEIALGVGVASRDVIYTYGNHDVDWRICDLASGGGDNHLNDDLYHQVAAESVGLFAKNYDELNRGPVSGSGVFRRGALTIFVVNSGYYCSSNQRYPHGKVGAAQLAWLKEVLGSPNYEGEWRVLMTHHHPFKYPFPTATEDISCIEEGAEIVDLAGKYGIHLVCHGHRHEPKIFTAMHNGWKNPITFVCAGSVAVVSSHRNTGELKNYFHVITLFDKLEDGAAFGSIKTFQYQSNSGWTEAQSSKQSPVDAVQWFGVVANVAEQESAIDALIEAALRSGDAYPLPTMNELSPTLRCMRIDRLNELLKNRILAKPTKLRLAGKFPDDVYLIPPANASNKH